MPRGDIPPLDPVGTDLSVIMLLVRLSMTPISDANVSDNATATLEEIANAPIPVRH